MSDLWTETIARTNSTLNTAATKTTQSNNAAYLQSSKTDNYALSMEDFLQLMIVQFQNQDIENPASTSEMMNQLMQMSTIQAMTTMTDAATMSYAASLVGKTVTIGEYTKDGLKEIVGQVTGTGTYDGERVIFVDGKSYALTSIMAVGELPPKEENAGDTDAAQKVVDGT